MDAKPYRNMLFQQLPPVLAGPQGHKSQKRLHIEELKQPDGTSLLIIDYEER